jgi:hypothetical protein
MMAGKQTLRAETLASQWAQALPERAMLDYSLVYVDAQTGDVNVLSYNELGTCALAAAGVLHVGGVVLQSCVMVKAS